ncbi:hypothetical protein RE6C_04762 [Rhodopirellula europaea 6C]|uniref:Uncharacterized protein n=1 Tax=Rhodopirellula europaea 6C TaxID=1263867 RepID=M2AC06_9BACT|nr:hypothetical protein RE6C_04762 [Rhodopirellula europaea 6C]
MQWGQGGPTAALGRFDNSRSISNPAPKFQTKKPSTQNGTKSKIV